MTFLSYYRDFNGDGRPDLVLPRIDKVTMWSILKVLITQSIPLQALVFFQRADGQSS